MSKIVEFYLLISKGARYIINSNFSRNALSDLRLAT